MKSREGFKDPGFYLAIGVLILWDFGEEIKPFL
jgi:hypothetical protein